MEADEQGRLQFRLECAVASPDGFNVFLAIPYGSTRLPDLFVIETTLTSGGGDAEYLGATYIEDSPASELTLHFRSARRPRGPVVLRIDAVRTDPTIDDGLLRQLRMRRSALDGLPETISFQLPEPT